jgi:hypothetical protein
MDARLQASGHGPGATIHLSANLFEYDLPLRLPADVIADVVNPAGVRSTVTFVRTEEGAYSADWVTTRPGMYKFTIRATGYTSGNDAFKREKVLTAGVWVGGDKPYDPQVGTKDGRMCELIHCVLKQVRSSETILRACKKIGLDLEGLVRCFDSHCKPSPSAVAEAHMGRTSAEVRVLKAAPQLEQLMVSLTPSQPPEEAEVLTAAKTIPVVRKPKRPGVPGNLFELPEREKPRKKE